MPFLSLCLLLLLLGSRAEAGEIIRGTESKPHSRPYMALLEITTSQNHTALCGGFLIRRDFVLTAAHCSGSSIKVTLGVHNQREKEGTWQKLEVVKQFLHPKYADFFICHEVMLLKLKEKANLTLAVGTLPLPPQFNFMPPGRMCRAVGWGKTSVKESRSNVLQEVKLRLLDPPACQHFPGSLWGPLLCAGVAQGIASYAHKNAMPLSVFTQISYYRPWINKVLKEN